MKNKAINALLEMEMPADIKGFRYIVDAMVLFEDVEIRTGKTTYLYHEIGKRNNASASQVERAIRHAFGNILQKGNMEKVEKYLTRKNTSNGSLLHIFYLRLTQED